MSATAKADVVLKYSLDDDILIAQGSLDRLHTEILQHLRLLVIARESRDLILAFVEQSCENRASDEPRTEQEHLLSHIKYLL